jgi:hypothetical protein
MMSPRPEPVNTPVYINFMLAELPGHGRAADQGIVLTFAVTVQ